MTLNKRKKVFISVGVISVAAILPIVVLASLDKTEETQKIKNDHSVLSKFKEKGWGLLSAEEYYIKLQKIKYDEWKWNKWIKSGRGDEKIIQFIQEVEALLDAYEMEQKFINPKSVWNNNNLDKSEKLGSDISGFSEWIRDRFPDKFNDTLIETLLIYWKDKQYFKNKSTLNVKEIIDVVLEHFDERIREINNKINEVVFLTHAKRKLKQQIK